MHYIMGLLALLVAVAFPHSSTAAETVTKFARTIEEDSAQFEQVGKITFRWKSVLKVYDIAFYQGSGTKFDSSFPDVPMRLELHYHMGFKAEEIIKGGDELLAKNVSAATLASLKSRLDDLNRAYIDIKSGERYSLTYVPGRGTTLRHNGKALTTIPGHDFAAAYFRIWLGTNPMSETVRDELIGS